MSLLKSLRRSRTQDKEAPEVYTTKPIGRTQSLTPEGFLLCVGVPIARTGTMIYGPGEVPIKPGSDGLAYVTRDAQALFDTNTIASYQGKAVVNDHPPVDVGPTNWRTYAIGTVLNPRRGVGLDADVILADLLITDAAAIRDVQAGKREVSAGYEADYQQTGNGEGRQTNIIGNHVALVARGRCGPRCAIGDHDSTQSSKGATPMATKHPARRVKLMDSIRAAFKDAGESLAETLTDPQLDGGPEAGDDDDGHTHIHIHTGGESPTGDDTDGQMPGAGADPQAGGDDPIEARFTAIEASINELKQLIQGGATKDEGVDEMLDGAGDTTGGDDPIAKTKTGDSAALATAFQKTIADAEILVPGFRVPTFDAALPRAKVVDNICQLRRKVLAHLGTTTDGASLLASVGDSPDASIDSMNCAQAAVLFKAAAAAKRAVNARATTGDSKLVQVPALAGRALSPAELNKRNAEFWAKHG